MPVWHPAVHKGLIVQVACYQWRRNEKTRFLLTRTGHRLWWQHPKAAASTDPPVPAWETIITEHFPLAISTSGERNVLYFPCDEFLRDLFMTKKKKKFGSSRDKRCWISPPISILNRYPINCTIKNSDFRINYQTQTFFKKKKITKKS